MHTDNEDFHGFSQVVSSRSAEGGSPLPGTGAGKPGGLAFPLIPPFSRRRRRQKKTFEKTCEDFEFQGQESEEIEVWEPVLTKAEDLDIQLPRDYTAIRTIGAEEVSVWMAVNQELMRQEITRQLLKLYTISFLVGLVVFAFTQNIWLLTTFGLLPILIRWIVGYWFRQPKK